MISLLLAIIYISFISLGLPDSLLGSGWPLMHIDIGADVSMAGLLSMLIAFFTIVSSVFSEKVTRKLGNGLVIFISIAMTAFAMLMFSFSSSFWQLCLLSIPYGLGAGSIDACLNNYVALNLSSKHMNWLHCCWGIGALISPYIMGFAISKNFGWQGGYRIVAIIQFAIAIFILLNISLWRKCETQNGNEIEKQKSLSFTEVFKLPGITKIFFGFLFYCATETLPSVWASTYFKMVYQIDVKTAALFGSLYFIGLTFSRCVFGFLSVKLRDKTMIRIGLSILSLGGILLCIPMKTYYLAVVAFVLIGLGCGPIYGGCFFCTFENG